MIVSWLTRRLKRVVTIAMPLIAAVAIAQAPVADVCTSIVQAALQAANDACSGTGRNQVCYGNLQGEAIPADGVTDLLFESVGDVAEISKIKALQLSPLDEAANEWGVALMQLQANLPDTLPGQNVTFLLFGDVSIEDAADEQVRIPATSLRATNVRLTPSLNGEVLGSLRRGAEVLATGKYTNGAGEVWLRLKFEDYRTRTGWAFGNLFDVRFADLPDVAPDSQVLNPMQAFYFRTGIGRTTCAEAPTSGVVVQTPDGAGMVNFTVNGVNVTLGSTAVLSADEYNFSVALIEGTGVVEQGGIVRRLVPGSETLIERFDSVSPSNEPVPPSLPQPISRDRFRFISEVLSITPRDVSLPQPATRDDITRANPIRGGTIDIPIQMPVCPQGTPPEQCACNDVDGDGICDAVPCSERFPTMCVPGCRDIDGDGKCDVKCEDSNNDGQCDAPPAECTDHDDDGVCDSNTQGTVNCLVPGPVVCDPTCENVDGDATCDAYDDCIDADGDGKCDCEISGEASSGCGSVPTPTPTSNVSPPIFYTPTPTPDSK